MIYVGQIILYNLNLYSAACHLYINEMGRKERRVKKHMQYHFTRIVRYTCIYYPDKCTSIQLWLL